MARIADYIPLCMLPGGRARKVSVFQRILTVVFGAPNARRANGILYSGFDLLGKAKRILARIFGNRNECPVFEIDRIGTLCGERLPRIWLSEEVFNTQNDDGSRIFVECYPAGPDEGGRRALELGDRYLGEGLRNSGCAIPENQIECLKAAEILYLHSVRRGNRIAATRLHRLYKEDLCEGEWHATYLENHARHARKRGRQQGLPRRGGEERRKKVA